MQLPLPVVLASGSPRRREILSGLIDDYTIEVPDVDELAFTESDPWKTAERLASAKVRAVCEARAQRHLTAAIVIGGDTVVAVPMDGQFLQLAKPESRDDAARMLRMLSGRRHAVITGVAVASPLSSMCSSDTAWVTFRELADTEIESYVATEEPMDKAGSYAIQGGAAGFVIQVEGDVETVIGLPSALLRTMLAGL